MSKKDKTRFLPPHILTKLAVILGLAFAMPNVFAASITPYYGFKSGDNYVLEVEADGSNGKVKTGATNEAGTASASETIVNSSDTNLFFGRFTTTDTEATNGQVTVKGGKADAAYGGYGATNATNVTKNTVTISGGTVSDNVLGGFSVGAVYNNTVVISGGTISGDVVGGANSSDETTSSATKNNVIISGGSVGGNFFGGITASGNADSNIVTITGGTISRNVFGAATMDGKANNNIVNITDATVSGSVFGGVYGHTSADGTNPYNNDAPYNVLPPATRLT